ncbi:hypothetical protein D7S86_24270 [Pararobbsia silviterrae]|uniref:Uncharacterized protein n=1 Tax=Pararobbsia silviterrae TaxID=1792498 RepID=A0A494X7B9_9BURK|nr:hypothetical protein D7S86_24270 [Pararobbsia silviterrae]
MFAGLSKACWPSSRREGGSRKVEADPVATGTAMREDFLAQAARLAIEHGAVSTNGERVVQMFERFRDALQSGEVMPDADFAARVIRPFVTWLSALTHVPDEGAYGQVAQCAGRLLKHIVVPESGTRRTLQQFGSTEQLDVRDSAPEIAQSFVEWTIPLLHRFVTILAALALGAPCVDSIPKLLKSIERHEQPDRGDEAETPSDATRRESAAALPEPLAGDRWERRHTLFEPRMNTRWVPHSRASWHATRDAISTRTRSSAPSSLHEGLNMSLASGRLSSTFDVDSIGSWTPIKRSQSLQTARSMSLTSAAGLERRSVIRDGWPRDVAIHARAAPERADDDSDVLESTRL